MKQKCADKNRLEEMVNFFIAQHSDAIPEISKTVDRLSNEVPMSAPRLGDSTLPLNHPKNRWWRRHPQATLATRKRYYLKRKRDAINAYGGKCACCEEARIEFLSIDHIKGNGNQHRRALGKANFYIYLKRNWCVRLLSTQQEGGAA